MTYPNDPGQAPQPAAPAYGQQPVAPVYGQQPVAPAYGQQPAAPAYGQQPAVPAYGQQPAVPAYGQAPQANWGAAAAPAYHGPAGYPPAAPGAGYPAGGYPGTGSYKEATVAWVLWIFLGFFGGHHFYLGNTKRAVAYLVGMILSLLTMVIFIGILGYIALFVLWIIDATQMSANLQKCNARIYAANRAAGLA